MHDLDTERCHLTQLNSNDSDDVSRLYRDADVRRYLGGPADAEKAREHFQSLLHDNTARTWTVRLKAEPTFIGIVGIALHHDNLDWEIFYQLLPAYWNHGYATECLLALLDHAASRLKLESVVAETQRANYRSRKLLERLGMTPARTLTRCNEEQILYRLVLAETRRA